MPHSLLYYLGVCPRHREPCPTRMPERMEVEHLGRHGFYPPESRSVRVEQILQARTSIRQATTFARQPIRREALPPYRWGRANRIRLLLALSLPHECEASRHNLAE